LFLPNQQQLKIEIGNVSALFFVLAIYSQKATFKILSAKIKCSLRFSIAKIHQNLRKIPDFYRWFKYVAKNIEGCIEFLLSYF
jgi:hypothetical protein